MSELLDALTFGPVPHTAEQVAVDATDRLLLDLAGDALAAGGPVMVIGDRYGALTLGALDAGARDVRVHQDDVTAELALDANAAGTGLTGYRSVPLTVEAVAGARTVLVQAPKSLAALAEMAQVLAAGVDPAASVLVGGRLKHLAPMAAAMNETLARSFAQVRPSLARQKSRVLVCSEPIPGPLTYPDRRVDAELGLTICAHGGAFAGTKIDVGTRAIAVGIPAMPTASTIVDLGCGTGVLAVLLARAQPDATVTAVDSSAAAVRSTAATAAANAAHIEVRRDHDLSSFADASVDLVVCNPPFHVGAVVDSSPAHAMFAAAGRVLRPGGELWTVFNSHLPYLGSLRHHVGPTRLVSRTPKFTVSASRRRPQ